MMFIAQFTYLLNDISHLLTYHMTFATGLLIK